MSQHVQSYLSLLDHGTPCSVNPPQIDPLRAVVLLARHLEQHQPVPQLGAWRMHPAHARQLEVLHHGAPAGGWAALAGLMGGTPICRVSEEGFVLATPVKHLERWPASRIQRALIESLTCRMAPPVTAAGFLLLMGIHPVAGIELAHHLHEQLSPWSSSHDEGRIQRISATLDHDAMLCPMRDVFFGAIATLIEALRSLRPHHSYPIDALAQLSLDICLTHRAQLWQQLPPSMRAQTFLFDPKELDPETISSRALDFATLDLLDAFLVPAGLARRLEGGAFTPCHDALCSSFYIIGVPQSERAMWLTRFLTHEATSLCA